MLRRIAVVTFASAVVLMTACGHQVTPEPLTSNLSGEVVVRVTTAGALDFNNFKYAIAIDTCGLSVPYPQAAFTSYLNYSYVFFIGGSAGIAFPRLFEYYFSSGNVTTLPVQNLNPSTTQFVPNYNGQGTEFQFTFLRADLDNPLQVTQPCPNIAPPPASASPTATATPTAGATATPTPNAFPTTPAQATWIFNVIVFNNANVPQDSLGLNGATDVTFQGLNVDTTSTNQNPFFRPAPLTGIPSNPSAQLTFAEVDNYL